MIITSKSTSTGDSEVPATADMSLVNSIFDLLSAAATQSVEETKPSMGTNAATDFKQTLMGYVEMLQMFKPSLAASAEALVNKIQEEVKEPQKNKMYRAVCGLVGNIMSPEANTLPPSLVPIKEKLVELVRTPAGSNEDTQRSQAPIHAHSTILT